MRLPAALSHSRVVARWAALLALSAALGGLFAWMRVPAAFLLGPMLAGILASWARHGLEVSRPCFAAAQGVVGCLIGGSIAASFSGSAIGRSWPAFAGGVLAVVVAAWLVGWGMLRLRVLPGTTIAWGLSPGAAPAMVILAESNGADAQLVAFMQYLRVLLVTAVASVMVRVLGVAPAHPVAVLPAVDVAWGPLLLTLAVAVPGALTAELLRAPAGAFLFPLVASVPLASVGLLSPLPRWILVAANHQYFGQTQGFFFHKTCG